ncbi:shikimate dehydrogenase [Pseudotenacibaculum sp. MALMAid0570]|uniref:shikimate dehydrogenase family protein n=1 Tax=Pseudotenacibaculum sp. MALMAid0570 TaxID=3143938 RepID=UPI0032DF13FA
MVEEKPHKALFGLVGKNISYSFSKGYFTKKFEELQLTNHQYVNFDIQSIEEFSMVIHEFKFCLKGLNVTIPYKQDIFLYLDKVDKISRKVGAVNTVRITKKGNLKGYNTDVVGFQKSLEPLLKEHHKRALILGTGGASKAVAYVLKRLGIDYLKVSRRPKRKNEVAYSDLNENLMQGYTIIVNCTPIGTFPKVDQKPAIPYQYLTKNHLLYDLIYNPETTAFLKEGNFKGAQIKNGFEMLQLQAEESWRIWNK